MRSSPVTVLNRLQHFLEIPFYEYKDKLVFDEKKGFYCQVLEGKKKVKKKFKKNVLCYIKIKNCSASGRERAGCILRWTLRLKPGCSTIINLTTII